MTATIPSWKRKERDLVSSADFHVYILDFGHWCTDLTSVAVVFGNISTKKSGVVALQYCENY